MPANGMLYAPPHPCACYLSTKLSYFNALSPASRLTYKEAKQTADQRLQRGPAYGKATKKASATGDDWPQYRCDITRSGATLNAVNPKVKTLWQTPIGSVPGPLVVAEGKVFVAAADRHTLYALDAAGGKKCWTYTTGGRIDSPPTCSEGLVVFGSTDGYVYCLTAAAGELVWRYRAAPQKRQMMAMGQLESPWPVHGSVLVRDGKAYCTAGRSRFLDGGILIFALDVKTGKLVSEKLLDETDDATDKDLHSLAKGLSMPVGLTDVLSANDKYLFMHSQVFDFEGRPVPPGELKDKEEDVRHLFTPTGFLDGTWFHRTYWQYGTRFVSGWNKWYTEGRIKPAGRILAHQGDLVFGFGRKQGYFRWSTPLEYHVFCIDKNPKLKEAKGAAGKTGKNGKKPVKRRGGGYMSPTDYLQYHWSKPVGLLVKAMALADKTLFIAGPPDLLDETEGWKNIYDAKYQDKFKEQLESVQGARGGALWAVAASSGEKLSELKLKSIPVFDGMAVAYGRVYLAMADGSVMCFGAE